MTLAKPLRNALVVADFARESKEMGLKVGKIRYHQVITGDSNAEMLDQAKEYARELIQRGALTKVPVEMNCDQPTSDHMVQEFFKEAKGGMIIVHNLDHLARHETFTSLTARAASEDRCIIVICGTKPSVAELLASDEGIAKRLPAPFDMNDAAIRKDMQEQEEQRKAAEIQDMLTLKNPIQPMRPLKLVPKPDK
jgi:hypothetical protein